jgi:hypothetical protein
MHGAKLFQDLRFRVGASRLFLGGKLSASRTDTSLRLDPGESDPIRVGLGETRNVGLAVQGVFDSRDTTFTPNRGQLFSLDVWRHDEAFGGDYGYWKTALKVLSFHRLTERLILGLRFEGAAANGDPPFWGYPWITLRGVPAMRYQNQRVGVAEVELRWNLMQRWAVIGFYGGGTTGGDLPRFESGDDVRAGGLGARYLFAADLGLWIGVDFARGPEDDVGYIQVGHAW